MRLGRSVAGLRQTWKYRQQSSRSERQHKAWGASPRIAIPIALSPRSGRQRLIGHAIARFHGLETLFVIRDPGAGAPGFMLSLASRALLTPASQAESLAPNSCA